MRKVRARTTGGSSRDPMVTEPWSMRVRALVVAILALALLGVLAVGWLLEGKEKSRASAAPATERNAHDAPRAPRAPRTLAAAAPVPAAVAAPASSVEEERTNADSGPDMLANYQGYAMYPPTSRPVTPARAASFKYNRRVQQFLPAFKSKNDDSPTFYSSFTADKVNVIDRESITITLKAAADASGQRAGLPISISNAGLTKGRAADAPKIANLDLRDDGQQGDQVAGDGTYTAVVDPSSSEMLRNHHGSVRAFVEFTANGASMGEQLFFEYSPKKAIAAELTGRFRETVEDGSLVVYAELDVYQPGHYSIDATLFSRDGRAFVHTRFKGVLEAGKREARLLFFGKAIRDASPAAESPFKVDEIYGQMVPAPDELLRLSKDGSFAPAPVPLYPKSYITARHDLGEFSDAEWNSPEKENQLDYYRTEERR